MKSNFSRNSHFNISSSIKIFMNEATLKAKQISIMLKSIKEERQSIILRKITQRKSSRKSLSLLSLSLSPSLSWDGGKVPMTELLKPYQQILRHLISMGSFAMQTLRVKREISLIKWNSAFRRINLINGNPNSDWDDAGSNRKLNGIRGIFSFITGFTFEFIKHSKIDEQWKRKSYQIIVSGVFRLF